MAKTKSVIHCLLAQLDTDRPCVIALSSCAVFKITVDLLVSRTHTNLDSKTAGQAADNDQQEKLC